MPPPPFERLSRDRFMECWEGFHLNMPLYLLRFNLGNGTMVPLALKTKKVSEVNISVWEMRMSSL